MRRITSRRLAVSLVLGLLAVAYAPSRGAPAEYRLRVASILEEAVVALLRPGELWSGASGSGLDSAVASIDQGAMAPGALLYDRPFEAAGERLARVYDATAVRTDVLRPGLDRSQWYEARWQGPPGGRTVWVIDGARTHAQQLDRVILRGNSGVARQYLVYPVPGRGAPLRALKLPLNFLQAEEERATVWPKYLSRALDLGDGLGVVVGYRNDAFMDRVYLVVDQGAQPSAYTALLVWKPREAQDLLSKQGGRKI